MADARAMLQRGVRALIQRSPLAAAMVREFAASAGVGAARAFEAASRGRRMKDWRTTNGAANEEIGPALPLLRRRSRHLADNTALAAKAVNCLVGNIVGEGIRPRSNVKDPELDRRVEALWSAWARRSDSMRRNWGFYAQQHQACGALVRDGEVLARRVLRPSSFGLDVPLQIELLESDMLPMDLLRAEANGGEVIHGVEVGADGAIAAYHLYRRHPGATLSARDAGLSFETVRVRRDEIAHLYVPYRIGALRGLPWLTPVITAMRDLDNYRDAERVRKGGEAAMMAFITGVPADTFQDARGASLAPKTRYSDGAIVETMQPGSVVYLTDGMGVEFNKPATVGGYAEYVRTESHGIAAGINLTYELLTGDLSQVNYSSIRAGLIEFHRYVKMMQKLYFIPCFCEPAWEWFYDASVAVGKLPSQLPVPVWTPPRFEALDRQKEAAADLAELKAGTRSFVDIVAEKGGDPQEIIEQFAATLEMLDAVGVTFEWDLRGKTATDGGATTVTDDSDEADAPAKPGGAKKKPNDDEEEA